MKTKRCIKCEVVRDIYWFLESKMADGYMRVCEVCKGIDAGMKKKR